MFSILISFLRSLLTPLYNLQTLLQRIHSLHSPRMPTVKATLKLFKPLDIHKDEKPFICEFNVKGLPGARPTNVELEPHQVPIHDIRGFERQFTLDQNGFEIVQHETSLALEDFTSPSAIESRYLGECQELVRQHCGAKQVVVIGYNLRDNAPGLDTKYKGAMRPFATVHIDQSQAALYARLEQLFGAEKAKRLSREHKCVIVNVWRALSDPVEDYPLTYCDTQTVRQSDCVAVDLVKRDEYEGETLYVRHSRRHRWYFLSKQRPHEPILLKMAESDPNSPGEYRQGLPHAAFELPAVVDGPPPKPRESIEVRLLVLV